MDLSAIGDASDLGIQNMLREPYPGVSITRLLDEAYAPYTGSVGKAMKYVARDTRRRIAILLSLHTIPPYTAVRLKSGHHTGACVLGARAERGEIHGPEDLGRGILPDIFLDAGFGVNGKPSSCSPVIVRIIRDIFRDAGLIVAEGRHSPWMSYGLQIQLANPAIGHHAIGIHQVGHNDLEPDRLNGSLRVNTQQARKLRRVYTKIFDALGGLTARSVRAGS